VQTVRGQRRFVSPNARNQAHAEAGSVVAVRDTFAADLNQLLMLTLRVTRHDRNEQLLADCQSNAIPARGEILQLDTLEADGSMHGPSTLWRIVAVTMHVPSLQSAAPMDGQPLRVRMVEVSVVPDVTLLPALHESAEQVLSESRM
jgi:hypothetical protein